MSTFTLHPELERSSLYVADLELCQVRLNFDGDQDWLILIPKKEDKKDWCDLDIEDQYQLTREIDKTCKILREHVSPDKLNVASLGNMVPQLHIHIICRYEKDRAWPGALFNTSPHEEFDEGRAEFWKSIFAN